MTKLSVPHRFIETVEEFKLLKEKSRVLAGISGGADSVCLLDLLRIVAPKYKLRISGIHINHGIREDADRDEEFVRNLARQWNIRLVVVKVDVPSFARRNKIGLELAARHLRYLHYRQTAQKLKCDVVALGHTADDNLETVIHNLVRGTGMRGLCGIPVQRDIFIRPLIRVTRQEVRDYLRARSLEWIEDETNRDIRFTRNLIRHQIIPLLEQINPGVRENVLRTSELLRQEDRFLNALAKQILSRIAICQGRRMLIDIQLINKYNLVLKRRIIKLLAPSIDALNVERVLDLITRNCTGQHPIQSNVVLRIENGKAEIIDRSSELSYAGQN